MVERALACGTPVERFARMVVALGGPADLVDRPDRYLPAAPVRQAVVPAAAGVITHIDARALGLLLVELGGGRRRAEDAVDVRVGLADVRGVGDVVSKEQPLAVIHARTSAQADAAADALRRAVTVDEAATVVSTSPVLRRIGAVPARP